jgi:predicted RNA-binding protein associated with RNAse of E/G family
MPCKYGNRDGWARIAEHTFTVARVTTPAFRGIVSLYTMLRVREPLYKLVCGERTLIAADGFRWLQLYSADPACQTYTVTGAFTSEKILTQWYIDICTGHGVNDAGVPWHDDLYLDLVANGRDALDIIDAGELDEALATAQISPAAYDIAWREAHRLAPLARSVSLPEMRFAAEALAAMEILECGGVVAGFTPLAGGAATKSER